MPKSFYIFLNGLLILLVLPFTVNISDATIFSWKDENGITHFTDSPEKIPPKCILLAQAETRLAGQLQLSTLVAVQHSP